MENKKYGGFFIRIFAGIIDSIILLPPLAIISWIFIFNNITQNTDFIILIKQHENTINLISLAISIPYLTYFVASASKATLGKKILGLYVGNIDGSKLSKKRSLARALMSIVTSMTLGLGFLPVLFTKERISLHDYICKTRVFRN